MGKKDIREAFREAVFKRDGFQCIFCGATDDLDAHHITDRHEMPNGGYVLENGITVCQATCHLKAEAYHMGLEPEDGFWPHQLYEKIGSSEEEARNASRNI